LEESHFTKNEKARMSKSQVKAVMIMTAARTDQSLQDLCLYQLREPTLLMAWQHLRGCLSVF
jgi:hypothetical protein